MPRARIVFTRLASEMLIYAAIVAQTADSAFIVRVSDAPGRATGVAVGGGKHFRRIGDGKERARRSVSSVRTFHSDLEPV